MSTSYPVGNGVRLTATFTNLAGMVGDPTTVLFKSKSPHGTIVQSAPTRAATGIYYIDLVLSMPGTWAYRWEGTGAIVAALDGRITASSSPFYT